MVEKKELKQTQYSVYYYVSGQKRNDLVVFLHPAFADHRAFQNQVDFFSPNYRVVTLDMPGHGLSKTLKAKDKIDATIYHIHSILLAEGYQKAHFVGVSMGSLIAQYFAFHYPDSVKSMTVLGGYDIHADNRAIVKAQRLEILKWIFKAIFSMNAFRRYVAKVSVSIPAEQLRFYEMAQMFTRKSFFVMSGLDKVVQYREKVTWKNPLLILCGAQDIEMALKMSKSWHEQTPSSDYHAIPDAGHCANMDNPEVFNRLVMEFFKIHE